MIPPLCETYCPSCGNNHAPTTAGCLRLSPFESFTVPLPAPATPAEVRCKMHGRRPCPVCDAVPAPEPRCGQWGHNSLCGCRNAPLPSGERCSSCGGNGDLFDIAALRVEADEWYALFQHEEDQREKAVADSKWLAWIIEKAPHTGNCATWRRGMLDCDCFKALAKEAAGNKS